MIKSRKYTVTKPFDGFLPNKSEFEIVTEELPSLRNGEFLVKAKYISVDPYMRSFANGVESYPYDQFGFQVGQVIKSMNKYYPENINVVSHSGWREFTILDGEPDQMFHVKPYEPVLGKLPLSFSLGALGMPGITAILGFEQVCRPTNKDVFCVTSAAGAVGSIAGQLARIKGCKVIGITGSDAKMKVLTKELGFHHAFNYKTNPDLSSSLKVVAPNGIDCFLDNVGGEVCTAVLSNIKEMGRVAICGSISTYGEERVKIKKPKMPISVKMEAFSFTQWSWKEQSDALSRIRSWIETGEVVVKETVTNNFTELPNAFVGMLKGENVGKALVKIV